MLLNSTCTVVHGCILATPLHYFCSNSRPLYHIGLVANFTERNGCQPDECRTRTNASTGEETYECTGCRHRWRWLDGSVLSTSDFDRWPNREPRLYSTVDAHCVAAVLDTSTGAYWWRTIVCDRDEAVYVCKAGLFLNSHCPEQRRI